VVTSTTTKAPTATTTTTEAPQKVDLQSFLDTQTLSSAERMYFERTYGKEQQLKTYEEWKKFLVVVR
jgi:hypothetical protein